jgi:hypothetical protein
MLVSTKDVAVMKLVAPQGTDWFGIVGMVKRSKERIEPTTSACRGAAIRLFNAETHHDAFRQRQRLDGAKDPMIVDRVDVVNHITILPSGVERRQPLRLLLR